MTPSYKNRNSSPVAWAAVAESAEYEDCIIGNRAGLEALRSTIDQAIQKGTAELPEHITRSMRVVLVDFAQNPKQTQKKKSLRDTAGMIGIGILMLSILAVFLVGISTISGWTK